MSAREAETHDFHGARDAADAPCVCPVEVRAIRSEMTLRQTKRLACKSCQARAVLEWLVELGEEP